MTKKITKKFHGYITDSYLFNFEKWEVEDIKKDKNIYKMEKIEAIEAITNRLKLHMWQAVNENNYYKARTKEYAYDFLKEIMDTYEKRLKGPSFIQITLNNPLTGGKYYIKADKLNPFETVAHYIYDYRYEKEENKQFKTDDYIVNSVGLARMFDNEEDFKEVQEKHKKDNYKVFYKEL